MSVAQGMIKAGASATVTCRLEFDNKSVADVVIIAEGNVKVGTNVLPKESGVTGIKNTGTDTPVVPAGTGEVSVTIGGVEARMGWNSGSSVTGKGLLQGVKIK